MPSWADTQISINDNYVEKLLIRDCAIITWRGGGGGVGKLEGGIGENDNKREGGLDVKFNAYRRALLFHSFLHTGKVVEELLEFK